MLVTVGCVYMTIWSSKIPPKVFWFAMAFTAYITIYGWMWHLCCEIIRGTMGKKDVLKRVNFDVYACMALGVKTIVWSILFFLPARLVIVGLSFLISDPLAKTVVDLVISLPFYLMMPLAMCHMAMPLTTKGWESPVLFRVLGKTLAPTLYWWIVYAVTNVVAIGLVVAGTIFFGASVATTVQALDASSKADAAAAANAGKFGAAEPAAPADPSLVADWVGVGIAGGFLVGFVLVYSFTAVYNMRSLGLLAYFFTKELELVTKVEDKAYTFKRKEVKLGPDGKPILTKADKIKQAATSVVVLIVVAGAGYYVYCNLTNTPPFWSSPAAPTAPEAQPAADGQPANNAAPAGDAGQPAPDGNATPPGGSS